MNTFTRKNAKVATRARVLDAARARLEAVGFEATSIRDVAKDAGVATGTVLLHFPDKTQLLHAAFFEDLAATWAKARARRPTKSLLSDLCAIADAFLDYYAERPSLSRTLLRESLFAAPPWQERFVAQIAEVQTRIVSLATEAQARGKLGALEPALLGAAFFSFYYFALLAWAQGGHPAPKRLFEKMLEQHLEGYLK